ncbi:type II toxin-antitoxin system VapC family toxin [Hyphobacterium marinum]|uniref:Type II toxin-antitoxin system VapC family toxin n=1 Tax=Hyphobacterium marinum TaxID=3116574 RepID=A0ABU7LZ43_9PROT|nr:type II toxin-antitoxin system VapC family toxin [Hyphobacterium sp. Y6023]MEE2566834.1 type II toxin-antitoxin system VapC family toxin [Hyphobacterium sp. Y6023]
MTDRLLLDTCAAIWLMNGDRMDYAAIDAIESSAETGNLNVSAFTAWEIATLAARGRISIAMPPEVWFDRLVALSGATVIEASAKILIRSAQLPGIPPKDPADRIILSTAREDGLVIVTRDKCLLRYGREGHVGVMSC